MRLKLIYAVITIFSIVAVSYPVVVSSFYGSGNSFQCAPLLPCQRPARASVLCNSFCLVIMKNSTFYPASINVTVGATVEWVNLDSVPHTSTSFNQNGWYSPFIGPGQSYNFTFTGLKPGTYYYRCNIHPFMEGTVFLLPNNQ